MLSAKPVDIVDVRITHKTARVPLLEAVSFKDKTNGYLDMRLLDGTLKAGDLKFCKRILNLLN